MKIRIFAALVFAFGAIQGAAAQGADEEPVNDLKAQFEYLKDRSNNYQDYKVVRKSALDNFWESVEDTLTENRAEISSLAKEVGDLEKQVADLQKQVQERDLALSEQEHQIEHMDFLGMELTKGAYITYTWTIIILLLVAVAFLWFRFKSAHSVTARTLDEFKLLQEEFEAHRKSSREKETKLRRDLQTEINKLEELKGKSKP